ncbi:Decaprenyl-diphosphate synthase subunit 1 [Merluccius polli]|uniref:All trans-polyprenyl-diphosphate synthase PDSS1 n=1 Tax=Merluccius polli TaxID=89951 RepID=A0AA47MJQ9_MERPO|nr:Decaprenyl-diphosphate synthase subunit 1 [Merluccius polli]
MCAAQHGGSVEALLEDVGHRRPPRRDPVFHVVSPGPGSCRRRDPAGGKGVVGSWGVREPGLRAGITLSKDSVAAAARRSWDAAETFRSGPVCPSTHPMNFSPTFLRRRARQPSPALQLCCCKHVHSDAKLKDPFSLAQKDLTHLYDDIKKELCVSGSELRSLCDYYFDGKGKAFRPMIVVLMARALNIHSNSESSGLLPGQRSVAMISEMIHTASLVHDDVIDGSDQRRGKSTINDMWGERKAILAGDFILSAASMALARIGNTAVVSVLSQVIEDLVRGEFMQMGSKENENERFKHYLDKTFKKTASLIANSCRAVSILVNSDPEVHEIAFQYGKNVGIAFQLVDDVLDFTACAAHLGKPSAADLKLGLATGPVLFACQQFPELHSMIMRRFTSQGDVEQAWKYVLQSDGVQQTSYLARRYCEEAVRQVSRLRPSPERDALIRLTEMVLTRDK